MGKKKLSSKEIEQILLKLRKSYDDYIIEYIRPFDEKRAFEDRYIQALRANIDLSRFFADEITVLNNLIEREKQAKLKEEKKKYRPVKKEKKNFADKIIEENNKKIEKYIPLDLHEKANEEVCKLYGAVQDFSDTWWHDIDSILRKAYLLPFSGPRFELETRIFEMTSSNSGLCPPRLTSYKNMLSNPYLENKNIEKEGHRCILEASFFLHDLLNEMKKQLKNERLNDDDKELTKQILDKLSQIISDFRIKDFKAGNGSST